MRNLKIFLFSSCILFSQLGFAQDITLNCEFSDVSGRELVIIDCQGSGYSFYGEGSYQKLHPKNVGYTISVLDNSQLTNGENFEIVPDPSFNQSTITFLDSNQNEIASGQGGWGVETVNQFDGHGSWQ